MKSFRFLSYTIISILLYSNGNISGQQLSPIVVSSSGGFYSNSAGMLSFTTGEMAAVQTIASPTNILTQGFQQSWDFGTATEKNADDKFSISIYPNPSNGHFNIMTISANQVDISMKIINILGVEIFQENFYQEEKTNIHPIQLLEIPQGLYTIMILARNKNSGEEYHFGTRIHIAR